MVQSNGDIKLVDYDNCRHIESKQGDVVDCIGTPEFTGKKFLREIYMCIFLYVNVNA